MKRSTRKDVFYNKGVFHRLIEKATVYEDKYTRKFKFCVTMKVEE